MKKAALFFCIIAMAFAPIQRKHKVYLVGDSTIANKEIKAYPETGWGMPFTYFFDSTIEVDNRAMNGRSTKSFIAESRWEPILNNLQEGDYVFVQFGHNDEVKTKSTYTPENEFRANLIKYVTETRSKKAIPVLITPVARRKFDANGNVEETHAAYAAIVREVAKDEKVPLIDLDAKSQLLVQQLGLESSKLLFNYLAPNEHPNYPEGRQDDTHFNELGARKMAEIVLAEIKALHINLADHIRPPLTIKK
jgi:lysophospholipase L1-like esterase